MASVSLKRWTGKAVVTTPKSWTAENYEKRVKDVENFLQNQSCNIPEFDNDLVRRLVSSIKVVSAEKLIIPFQSGIVMEQEIRKDDNEGGLSLMDYIEMVEQIREELIQMFNRKCDAMVQIYQNGSQTVCLENRVMESELAWIAPATLKGKKPIELKFTSGESVKTPTWKSVVQTILQYCNSSRICMKGLCS